MPAVEIVELSRRRATRRPSRTIVPFEPELEQMRLALTLGLRDYVEKNGFAEVVVGVSGGIDSAVTAALCAEALGPERVHCVSMPSRFSSEGTRADARARREPRLRVPRDPDRVRRRRVPRRAAGEIEGGLAGLAAENLQARVRGVLLMALSNTYGWLVVSTGNKSELAVGYSTLYGDMVGGFALLKDVFKTDVYRLARHLNERAGRELDPREARSSVRRARSCGTTSATRTRSRRTTCSTRYSRRTSRRTGRARSCSRSSTPMSSSGRSRSSTVPSTSAARRRPGVKLRPKAFGRDRRTPITNRFSGLTRHYRK